MNIQIDYYAYPEAIKEYISDHFTEKNAHFGNMQNNLSAIIKSIGLDDVIECELIEILPVSIEVNFISLKRHSFKDFPPFTKLKFKMKAKEGIDNDTFKKAVDTFFEKFHESYQMQKENHAFLMEQKRKRNSRLQLLLIGITVTALLIYVYIRMKQGLPVIR